MERMGGGCKRGVAMFLRGGGRCVGFVRGWVRVLGGGLMRTSIG